MTRLFAEILLSMENDDLQVMARDMISVIPDYFWHVPASSTGKYHPSYALGEGGLVRHTVAVVRFLNHIFGIQCFKNRWTSRERDLLRIAAMMHDTFKSGSQAEYEQNKYTKHEHPMLAAQAVMKFCDKYDAEEVKFIAICIESHMGEWNTSPRSDVVLPTPKEKSQQILHLADYLASRKDIEVLFS